MDETRTVRWRRDASTSRLVRVCWALGAGTLLGAISLVVIARVFGLAAEVTGESAFPPLTTAQVAVLAVALLAAAAVVGLAVAAALDLDLPLVDASAHERVLDAGVGAVLVSALVVAFASQVEGNAGEFLAVGTIPVGFGLLVFSVFLRSTGALDPDEGVLYRYDPDEAIDLDDVEDVSVRPIGGTALVSLTYAQPGGEYVPGPRRLLLPPTVARELRAAVESS